MQQTITGQVFTAAGDEWAGAVVEIQFDTDADARPDSPSVTALTGSDGTFTATVYNNSSEVRTALLRLPDDSTFAIEIDPEESEIAAGTLIAFSQAPQPRLSGQAASGGGGSLTMATGLVDFTKDGVYPIGDAVPAGKQRMVTSVMWRLNGDVPSSDAVVYLGWGSDPSTRFWWTSDSSAAGTLLGNSLTASLDVPPYNLAEVKPRYTRLGEEGETFGVQVVNYTSGDGTAYVDIIYYDVDIPE